MCGRFRLTRARLREIEEFYQVDDVSDLEIWKREYNIPPREMAPIIFDHQERRRLTAGLWSLMPSWATSLAEANRASTFNAKAETLKDKPSFKNAFLRHRCIVPAEAFYEWIGPKGAKQPLNIARKDGKFLSLAGLFSYWKPEESEGRPIPTFAVITTTPNQWMARIHNRMPVILQDDQLDTWLDPSISEPKILDPLLKAPSEDFLECYPVSREINSVKNDSPQAAAPIELDYAALLNSSSGSTDDLF